MKQPHKGEYPADWPAIAKRVKDEVGWRCIRCDHPHEPAAGYTLTVHHADTDKGNVAWYNLLPLCQRCHLSIQGRVVMDRPWMIEHSEWFKPYVAGFYAHKYLGLELTRPEATARLDELLALEVGVAIGQRVTPPITHVATCLIADLYGIPPEEVTSDLLFSYGIGWMDEGACCCWWRPGMTVATAPATSASGAYTLAWAAERGGTP